MRAVLLPDPLYIEAQQAAVASGLSLESYVAEAVQLHLRDDPEKLDHRFTPEVVACLDRAADQADAGDVITFDQYEAAFRPLREAWLNEHPSSR